MFWQRIRYIHVLGGVCAGAQVLNDLLSNYHRSLLDVMYMKDSLSRAKYSTLASCQTRSTVTAQSMCFSEGYGGSKL